jgi:hypothetical protein
MKNQENMSCETYMRICTNRAHSWYSGGTCHLLTSSTVDEVHHCLTWYHMHRQPLSVPTIVALLSAKPPPRTDMPLTVNTAPKLA